MLREFRSSDIEEVRRIYNEHHADTFGIFNFNKVLDHGILEENGKIIALGAVKMLAEAMIILDMGLPKTTRTKAIIDLLKAAIERCKDQDIEQLHAFIKDEKYAQLLIERFGFKRITDIPLVLNIKEK